MGSSGPPLAWNAKGSSEDENYAWSEWGKNLGFQSELNPIGVEQAAEKANPSMIGSECVPLGLRTAFFSATCGPTESLSANWVAPALRAAIVWASCAHTGCCGEDAGMTAGLETGVAPNAEFTDKL